MHRICLVGVLLLAGCQGIVGPRQRAELPQRVDVPCLPMDEQKRRAREMLALPDNSPSVGPQTWMEPPDAVRFGGRGPGQ
jgi:hypothetical protein